MKRVLALLACLVLSVAAFASCNGIPGTNDGGNGDGSHTHTYATEWSKDAEGHWYEATCECTDVTETKLNHVDANNDGACDVCTYTDHTHTYETETWTVNCTKHWRAATCGHIVAGIDEADHADTDGDGKCDVCAYVIEDIHKHYYATEWSSDAENHWHAALCEHEVEVADKEAHNLNAAGICTVCEARVATVDRTNFEAVLNAAMAQSHKVVSGTVGFVNYVYGGNHTDGLVLETGLMNEVYYTLGNGDSYISMKVFDKNGNFTGLDEQWFETLEDGTLFGVMRETNSINITPCDAPAAKLNGYNYMPGSYLATISEDTSTLANTLAAMYSVITAGKNVSDIEQNYDEKTGVYSFSYTWFTVNTTMSGDTIENIQVELYNASAEFSVNEDFVIDNAEFAVAVYRNFEADMDLSYDPDTNKVTLLPGANPTVYAYAVGQTSGERTFTSPYPKASLMPTDFELYYVTEDEYDDNSQLVILDEELLVDKDGDGVDDLTLAVDEYVRLHLGNLIPITALASFLDESDFEMTFVNNDENATGILWKDEMFIKPSYSAYSDCITFRVAEAGNYTVTIKFGKVTKTISVTVAGEVIPELPEDTADTKYVMTTDTNGWDDEYTYTAAASGTYTFTVPEGLGFWLSTSDQPEVDFNNQPNGGIVTVEIAEGKTITFNISAETRYTVFAIGVSFVAGDVTEEPEGGEGGEGSEGGTIASDISGTYYAGSNTLVIGNDGTMTFTYGATTLNYTYRVEGNEVYYSLNGNNEYTATNSMAVYFGYLTFNAEGKPATFEYNNVSYALTTTPPSQGGGNEGGEEEETKTLTVGNNTIEVTDEILDEGGVAYTFVVINPGTYTFNGDFMARVLDADGNQVGVGSVSLTVGTYTVNLGTGLISSAGSYNLEIAYTAPTVDEEGGSGTESDPYVRNEFPGSVTFESNTYDKVYYVFTAQESGTVNFTWPTADSWFGITELDANGDNTSNSTSGFEKTTHSFVVTEGTQYSVYFGTWNVAGEVTITITWGEATGGEGGEGGGEGTETPTPDYEATIVVGENTVWISADEVTADTAQRPLSINEDGNYSINAGSLFVGSITDANGNPVEKNEDSTYDLVAGDYTVTFSTLSMFGASADTALELNVVKNEDEEQTNVADGSFDNPYDLDAENTLEFAGGYDYVFYKYTAGEAGTLTITVTSDDFFWGYGEAQYAMENVGQVASAGISLSAGQVIYIGMSTNSAAAGTVTFTSSFEAGASEPTVKENPLVIGNNAVNGADITFVYTAEAEITLNIAAGNAVMGAVAVTYSVNGGAATEIANGSNVNVTLAAGDKLTVTATTTSGYLTIVVTEVAGEEEEPATPDGSSSNPYVIETLPATMTVVGGGASDLYFAYTNNTDKDVVIVVSVPDGALLSLPDDTPVTEGADGRHITVAAGTTMVLNPWTMQPSGTYEFTVSLYVEPEQGGEEEGGDDTVTGEVKTWVGANGSGRAMQVTIDAAAGTMSVIRAALAGNSLDTANGATESVYTYSFDGTNVTYTFVSGTSVTMTFDENGNPVSVVWASATYTDFVLQ